MNNTVYLLTENLHADALGSRPVGVYADQAEAEAARDRLYYGGKVTPLPMA